MRSIARKSQPLAKRAKSAPSARSRASAARATALAPSSETKSARATTRAVSTAKAQSSERRSAKNLPIRSSPFATGHALRPTLEKIHAAPVTKPVAKTARAAPPRGFVRKPVMQELEGRLLLSADLNPAAQDTLLAVPALQGAEFRALVEPGSLPAIASMQVAPILRTNEIVFVDTATPEYEALVADMRDAAAAQGRHLEFVLIDAERDGIRKITDTLAQRSDLDAIHVISHASDGAVQLGSTRLDFETLAKRAAAIKTWGNALTESGDLLIYGCDLAASQEGKSLVDALAKLTGADVAASEDLTGSAALGGNWKLEFATGAIEAQVAVSAAGEAQWRNVLASEQLDWDSVSWPAGTLNNTYAVGSGNVAITIGGNTGQFLAGYPVDNSTFNTGGLSPAQNSLHLNVNFTSNAQQITITIDFTHPGGVSDVSFTVFDIDNGSGTPRSFIDQVAAFATIGGVGGNDPTSITLVGGGTTTLADTDGDSTNDAARGNGTTANAGSTSAAGNATFTFAQSGITRITLVYNNVAGAAADPANQAVSLHDISFTANRAPVLATGSTLNYTENGAAAPVNAAITVTDIDSTTLASATVSITGNFASGQDVLGFVNGAGMGNIAGSYDAGTGVLTLTSAGATATLAEWQTALRAVMYSNSSDAPSTAARTVSFVVNDGLINSNTVTSTVNVTAVNDAPVNTVPGAQTTLANVPLVFSSANGNLISVDDVDAANLQVTLSVTAGTLTLSGVAGLAFTTGDGTADALMTFSGTKAAVNAALAGMSFVSGTTGSPTLTVTTSDLGATGTGGTLTDADTVAIAVLPRVVLDLDSTPTVSSGSASVTTNLVANFDMTAVTGGVPTSWSETGDTGDGAAGSGRYVWTGTSGSAGNPTASLNQTLTVPANTSITTYVSTGATLVETTTATTNTGITQITFDYVWANTDTTGANDNVLEVSYNGILYARFTTGGAAATTGAWTYFNGATGTAGAGIAAQGAAATGTLSTNTITLASAISATGPLTFTFANGPSGGGSDDVAIDNVVVNNTTTTTTTTTTVDLANNGWSATYTENGTPVAIADTDSSIFDAASATIVAASVTLTNPQTGDRLLVNGSAAASGTLASGIAWTRTDTAVALSGTFSKAAYADAIELVQLENTTDDPSTVARVINVVVNDGTSNSNVAVATINVTAVNDEPTLSATAANPTYTEDGAAVTLFSGTAASTIEAGQTLTRLDLTVSNLSNGAAEQLTIDGTTFSLVNGASGTTATNAMAYSVTVAGSTATVSLTKGAGISSAAMQTLVNAIAYQNTSQNPTAGARVVTLTRLDDSGSNVAPNDNTATLAIASTVTVVAVNDAPTTSPVTLAAIAEDSGARIITQAELLANASDAEGNPMTATGLAISAGGGTLVDNGDGTWTYTPDPDDDTGVAFSYAISDGSAATAGSASLDITPVNDAPEVSSASSYETPRDTPLAFTSAVGNAISVSDVDSGTLTVTLSVTNGTLTLSGTSGLAFGAGDGTNDATMTFTGAIADINAALDGLVFTPTAGFLGTAALTISTSDGVAPAVNDSLDIAVTTQPPRLDLEAGSPNDSATDDLSSGGYAGASGGAIAWSGDWVENDPEGAAQSPSQGDVQVESVSGNFVISLGDPGTNNGGTAANRAAAWRTVDLSQYINATLTFELSTSGNLEATDRYIVEASRDGGATFTILQSYQNDVSGAQSVSLSGYESSSTVVRFRLTSNFAANEFVYVDNVAIAAQPTWYSTTYTENAAPVAVASTNISITDVDSTTLSGATITLTNPQAGDLLSAGAMPGGITATVAGNVVTLSGSATLAAYQTAIQAVGYSSSSENPSATPRTITVVLQGDFGASSNVATTTISVTPVNDAPVIDDATVALDENSANGTAVYDVNDAFTGTDADRDGSALTYSITAGNALGGFAINPLTGQITVANGTVLDYETTPTFVLTIQASDGTLADTAQVTINLNDLDDTAPVVTPGQSFSYAENQTANAAVATVAATDAVGVTGFQFSATGTNTSADTFFTIDNAGVVRITAAGVAAGVAQNDFETAPNAFTYDVQARDAAGNLSAATTITLNVTDFAEPPTATNLSAPETYTEDTPLDLTDIVVSDPDSPNVTVTLTLSNVAAGSLNTGTSGTVTSTFVGGVWTASGPIADVNALLAGLTFTPAPNYNGNFTIATSVSDGTFTIAGTKNVTGVAVDDLPVANDDVYAATEDTVLNVPALTGVLANDAGLGDGGLVLTVTVGPANGLVTLNNNGSFVYTPNTNSNGADSFTYRITDADGDTATATVTINVAAVNDPPIPLNNSFVITSGGTLVLSSNNLSATDVDSPPLLLVFNASNVVNGYFEFVGLPGPITAFTQAQILGNQVQFVHTGGSAPSFDLTVSDGTAFTGPYPGNIVFIAGTPAPGTGGGGDAAAAIAGLFDTAAPPPAAIAGELAFAPVQAAPLVLPAPLIGLADRFGVAFTRTPTIATSAISESGPAGFAEAAPVAQAVQGPIEARIGADRGLPPIKVAGDVIETRIAAPEIAVERLRADELEVRASDYVYACVPETVDPFVAAPLRAVPSEQRLEPDADDRWRLGATTGALTITGLAVAAGGLWWAARASGLVSGLLAAAPTWRHLDPMPAIGRDKKKKRVGDDN